MTVKTLIYAGLACLALSFVLFSVAWLGGWWVWPFP